MAVGRESGCGGGVIEQKTRREKKKVHGYMQQYGDWQRDVEEDKEEINGDGQRLELRW